MNISGKLVPFSGCYYRDHPCDELPHVVLLNPTGAITYQNEKFDGTS